MDSESGKQQLTRFLKKHQFIILAVLIGVFLMVFPTRENELQEEMIPEVTVSPDLETELAAILSRISGVGKTEVLLTEAVGRDVLYQMDTGYNAGNFDTVIVTGQNREETGLVKQILPPVYRGAVVVCEGADSASVRFSVTEAVKSVTGLSSNCITVLKME